MSAKITSSGIKAKKGSRMILSYTGTARHLLSLLKQEHVASLVRKADKLEEELESKRKAR